MNPENKIIRDDVASILAEPINWEKLRGGAILLTGASGMLGSYILDTLITLNEDRDYGMTVYGLMREMIRSALLQRTLWGRGTP